MIHQLHKRALRQKYVLRPDVLRPEDATRFSVCTMDNPIDTPEEILNLVESGRGKVFRFESEGKPLACAVVCILEGPLGKELMVEAVAGKSEVNSHLPALIATLERLAKESGCKSIRCNTVRPGLIKRLLDANWFVSEVIVRKAVA